MKKATYIETIIFLYAILFLYTAISKLLDYSTFKEQLSESPILSSIAGMVAITVPLLEFIIMLMLIIPHWRLKGLYAAAALMVAFTIYVITLLSFSDKVPCSCGGIIAQLSWPQHLLFNAVFIVLAIAGIILQKRQKKDSKSSWATLSNPESSFKIQQIER